MGPSFFMVYGNRARRGAIALAIVALLAACADDGPPPAAGLRAARAGPVTAMALAEARAAAADAAERALSAPRVPRIEPAAAPFLFSAPEGRAFLAAPVAARALARGAPREWCPTIGLAAAPEAADPAAAAERALRRCLAARDERARAAGCGCRLLALGDALLAPQSALDYAPGVGARLIGLGDGRPLIARETPAEGAGAVVAFESAAGRVAEARLAPDGTATLTLDDGGAVFEGRRERLGWRRGRIVERLLLRDAAGRRLIALIGIEPLDYAAAGPALAAWPREGV